MPFNQYLTGNYFGFMPVQAGKSQVQVNPYLVSSSEGAIYVGDCLMLTSIGTVKQNTGSARMVGVAAGSLAANGGSTAASLNTFSTTTVLVWDDPSQIFMGCDTSSGIMNYPSVFKNVAVVVGSTVRNGTVNASGMAISAVTASSGSGFPFKVIGLHPLENQSTVAHGTAAASTNVRRWLLQPNHILSANAEGNITS